MKINCLIFLGLSLLSFKSYSQSIINGCSQLKSFNNNINVARVSETTETEDFDINYVKIDLKADNTSTYIEGNVLMKSTSLIDNLSAINLELVDPFSVDSVFYNGSKLTYSHSNDVLVITLNPLVAENELFDLQIFYHGDPATGGFFSGISHDVSNSWGNEVTWTLSEPLNAKQWWPSKQVLEDKIDSSDVFITVPNHLKVGSNGVLKQVVALDANTDRYEWQSRNPIAYYLISFAIAEYEEYDVYAFEGSEDELLIQNYLYNNPNVLPTYKSVIDQVPSMIELYSELYGMYPFMNEKYGHTMAELGGGAMEHQTMTTMTDFSFNTTAHELAHQWFGNQVTCGTWQDIWVNEGFASYSEYIANEFLKSKNDARNWLQEAHSYAFQRPTGSIYVPIEMAEDEGTIFNYRLTYKKGGSIIHMIRRELDDDELFFSIMKEYQTHYKNTTALGVDFESIVEQKSGKDFTKFFDQWYFGEGFPSQRFEWTYQNDSLIISSTQTTSSNVTPLFNIAIDVNLIFDDSDSIIRLNVDSNVQTFKFFIPREVVSILIDPEKDLLMKILGVTYIRPEEPEVVLSINKTTKDGIRIYPNPSNGDVMIKLLGKYKGVAISVIDARGGIITSYNSTLIETNKYVLNGLLPGLYVIVVATNNQIISQKMIIR